jgi:hypothetical protein
LSHPSARSSRQSLRSCPIATLHADNEAGNAVSA